MVQTTEHQLALEFDDEDLMDGEIVITPYEIRVKTSDISEAGTDSNVFLELVGDKARTKVQLTKQIWLGQVVGNQIINMPIPGLTRGMLEQKAKDVFLAHLANVGNLLELRVIKDDAGDQQGWHLKWISVTNKLTNVRKYFVHKKWIGTNGNGFEVILQPQDTLN